MLKKGTRDTGCWKCLHISEQKMPSPELEVSATNNVVSTLLNASKVCSSVVSLSLFQPLRSLFCLSTLSSFLSLPTFPLHTLLVEPHGMPRKQHKEHLTLGRRAANRI